MLLESPLFIDLVPLSYVSKLILIWNDLENTTIPLNLLKDHFKLLNIEHKIEFYIPNRYREGYGVSKQGIDYAISKKFSFSERLLKLRYDCYHYFEL